MKLWAASLLAGLALVSERSVASELDIYAHPQRLISLPDRRRMNLYCTGNRGPVVILDAGLGGSTLSWGKVQPKLASSFRVCAYDRAGMGFSDPGPLPRDTQHMADDLAALLTAAKLSPPYILVGHSLGGMSVRLFAAQHRQMVSGLVLVDPSVEHQDARFNAAIGTRSSDGNANRKACLAAAIVGLQPGTPEFLRCVGKPRPSWSAAFWRAISKMKASSSYHRTEVSEYENMAGANSSQLGAWNGKLTDIPMIVLTAENTYRSGVPREYVDTLSALWNEMHNEIARLSRRGVNRLVRGSGHLIPSDNPVAVAAAVRDVAVMARAP